MPKTSTKENLKGCRIAIQLISGDKIFGKVSKWSRDTIWVIQDRQEKPIDIPRDIIVRSLVLLPSGELDE